MSDNSHSRPLLVREAALGVLFATIGAVVLIGAMSVLATVAPQAEAARALKNLRHQFPVPARHTYGDGFGAGRGHQGQDVFARCGKPVVAARRGRVQKRGRHSSAGNYIVVDGDNTRVDYVYMHLRRTGLARRGQRVRNGQRVGRVGKSGNASGCHLHFELWSGPGWYEGGHAMRTVTTHLRRWDRQGQP